jgi:DNA-binding NtrC family response regulator
LIPPLRERRHENAGYVQQIVRESCERAGRPALAVSSATRKQLETFSWPGNIRELRNVIDRAVVLCTGDTIQPEHVILSSGTLGIGVAQNSLRLDRATDLESQRQAIVRALEQCDGNQTQAAEMLGISRRTLLYRMDSYALPRPRKR